MELNDKIIFEINARARAFVDDNFTDPTPNDVLVIENAMLIGASIVLEKEAEEA